MKKVNTVQGYDFYVGQDESKNFKPWYNIAKCGEQVPTKGFYSAEYVAKQFKLSPSFFFAKS